MSSANDILLQHPFNPVTNLRDPSNTDKKWADKYRGVQKLYMWTDASNPTWSDWAALVPTLSDNITQRNAPSQWPNRRARWELSNEDDGASYFRAEILSPVLSKFVDFPAVHERSFPTTGDVQNKVDIALMWAENIAVIGEFKRNLIDRRYWEAGTPEKKRAQDKLARELRGYAFQYQCPQVFCYDIHCLMLVQFKAVNRADLKTCEVDCWIFRRCDGDWDGYPLRDALFRFVQQGIRRLQSLNWSAPRVGSHQAMGRAFYSGEPLWPLPGGQASRTHPEGYYRDTDENGRLCWKTPEGEWWLDAAGEMVCDSIPLLRSYE